MEIEKYITAKQFCELHEIDISFITSLNDLGIVTTVIHEEVHYIDIEKVADLEKMIRLYYDLDINPEGIEAISHLLNKVNLMQEEIVLLKNRIRFLEGE
jgi:hypothetical protein